jgi:hypothetical protein
VREREKGESAGDDPPIESSPLDLTRPGWASPINHWVCFLFEKLNLKGWKYKKSQKSLFLDNGNY